jgi:hypothetical protein
MTLLSDYVAEVQKRIEREKESLARGSATSYDEYARKCGVISGMGLALEILKDLFQSTPSEERD